ncbi:HD domain-containing protein [Solibacillus sp. R5-41]|uniref:HD domain-containing protein n=1 Tax=Solibacillus sp. R5-41 TaxID=2048654 RepID=UPI0012FD8AEC|nr:HD domain-containing protein [Solibacillus sp. R5-41]
MKDAIIQKCNYLTEAEVIQLQSAMAFSEKAHQGQTRATGEPYIIHPLEVCLMLSEYHADITSLISALLHDVVEDTHVSLNEIKEYYGSHVSFIVDGLTKFEKGSFENEEYKAINTEKLLSTALLDIRVAVIKLADRLHNMRTLAIKRIEKTIPYANETLLFFSPLAEKVGLYKLQEELEDLGFSYLNSHRYTQYKKIMEEYTLIFTDISHKITDDLQLKDLNNDIIHVEWRKTPLYKSYILLSEGQEFSDLFTIHITTKTTLKCYSVLGIIHSLFEHVPHKLIDHIAIEKHPFIKYLETKVRINQLNIRVVIHDEATSNFYKHGVFEYLDEIQIQYLSESLLSNSIHSIQSIAPNSVAFCDLISFELFQKEITVFTPNLDSITLPENSNIIDFAFAFNPSLANRMAFAKVNGEVTSLQTILQDMDIVEIHTNKQVMVTTKWLIGVKTSKAIKEIMQIIDANK